MYETILIAFSMCSYVTQAIMINMYNYVKDWK